jgi:hypothetical protein
VTILAAAQRHDRSPGCAGAHCHSHDLDEPQQHAYVVCGACGHAYPSGEHLLAALAALEDAAAEPGAPPPPPLAAHRIWFCPLCLEPLDGSNDL